MKIWYFMIDGEIMDVETIPNSYKGMRFITSFLTNSTNFEYAWETLYSCANEMGIRIVNIEENYGLDSVSLNEDDPDNAIWFDFIQRLKDSEFDGVFHDLHTYPDCDAPD